MKNLRRIPLVILVAATLHAQRGAPTSNGAPVAETLRAPHGSAATRLFLRNAYVRRPCLELQWKLKLANQQRQLNSLTPAVTIGGSGRFPLSVVGGSSNNFHGFDNVSGVEIWDRQFGLPQTPEPRHARPALRLPARARRRWFHQPLPRRHRSDFTPPGTFQRRRRGAGQGHPARAHGPKTPANGRSTTPSILKLLDEMMTQPGQEARGRPAPPASLPLQERGGASLFGGLMWWPGWRASLPRRAVRKGCFAACAVPPPQRPCI